MQGFFLWIKWSEYETYVSLLGIVRDKGNFTETKLLNLKILLEERK
jgi:hypothetical protein